MILQLLSMSNRWLYRTQSGAAAISEVTDQVQQQNEAPEDPFQSLLAAVQEISMEHKAKLASNSREPNHGDLAHLQKAEAALRQIQSQLPTRLQKDIFERMKRYSNDDGKSASKRPNEDLDAADSSLGRFLIARLKEAVKHG